MLLSSLGLCEACCSSLLQEDYVKTVSVVRYYRLEDVDPSLAHSADFWDVVASTVESSLDASSIVGKCNVVAKGQRKGMEQAVLRFLP